MFAFGPAYCVEFTSLTLLRCVGFLGCEGRTSARRRNRAGHRQGVGCRRFAISGEPDLLGRPLGGGVALSGCSAGTRRASLLSAGLGHGLAVRRAALHGCCGTSENLGCCGNQILRSLAVIALTILNLLLGGTMRNLKEPKENSLFCWAYILF